MDLITPGIGLTFWTALIFGILLLILKFFVWKPISGALDKRNKGIEDALQAAEQAREEMKNLKADNERILAEASSERDNILLEAKSMKEEILNEARNEAIGQAKEILKKTQKDVASMKAAAFEDIKNQVLALSIAIAEKILREELKDTGKQEKLVEELVNKTNLN